jgi:predicted transposase/invertase (TIGR01784 family)
LAEHFSVDIASWLLGTPISLTKLEPSELFAEPIRADAVIFLEAEDLLAHIEFQTDPDPAIGFRMADYRLRGYHRNPQKQMRQIVVYLRPTRSPRVYQTTFEISGLRGEFEVIPYIPQVRSEEIIKAEDTEDGKEWHQNSRLRI